MTLKEIIDLLNERFPDKCLKDLDAVIRVTPLNYRVPVKFWGRDFVGMAEPVELLRCIFDHYSLDKTKQYELLLKAVSRSESVSLGSLAGIFEDDTPEEGK